MKSNKMDSIVRDIQQYFHFLFERGFEIYSVQELSMGDWRVTLALRNLGLVVYSDQGEIGVLFSPIESNLKYRVGLEAMIYFLSREQVFIGKSNKGFFNTRQKTFETLSGLVNDYIERIIPYFGEDYEQYKPELLLTQQKYLDIFLNRYIPKRKQ